MKNIILLVFLVMTSKAYALGNANQSAAQTSIIQLISTPEKYDGKIVRVIGVANFEFEGNQICLHTEDLENSISKNCLWLTAENNKFEATYYDLMSFNGKYVLIEGVFKKNNKGHMNQFSGAIESLNRLDPWVFTRRKK